MERLTDKELSAIFNKPLKNLLDVMNLQRATAQAQLEKDSADLKRQLAGKAPEPAKDMVEAVARMIQKAADQWDTYLFTHRIPEGMVTLEELAREIVKLFHNRQSEAICLNCKEPLEDCTCPVSTAGREVE